MSSTTTAAASASTDTSVMSMTVADMLGAVQNAMGNASAQSLAAMADALNQHSAALAETNARLTTISNALASLPGIAFAARTTSSALLSIQLKEAQMSQTMQQQYQTVIDGLTADVTAQTTVANGVQVAFAGLSGQLSAAIKAAQDLNATPEQLAALTALDESVKSNTSTLVTATTQGTAAATETPAAPIPPTTDPATPAPTPDSAAPPPPTDPTASAVDPATGLPTT